MIYHLFEDKRTHCLLNEIGEVVISGTRAIVHGFVTKRLPVSGTTLFYYRRSSEDGITFEKYSKWVGKDVEPS